MTMLVLGSVVSFLLTVNLNVVLSVFFLYLKLGEDETSLFFLFFCIDVAHKNNGNRNKLQKKRL